MSDRAQGVDVSHWHPVTNWSLLSSSAHFIGIKTTEGLTSTDPTFGQHRRGWIGSGLELAIFYHFARTGDPVEQAKRFVGTVQPNGPRERVCLDLERDITDLTWVDAFFGELFKGVCANGPRPLIYTSARIWKTLGDPPWDLAGEVDLWVPRYSTQEPELPHPWARWTIWQDSQNMAVPGVDGACDHNWFNGSAADLAAYAAPPVAPVAA